MKLLGENIRREREKRKIGLNKLASLADMSAGYLSDIENNKVSNPSIDKLEKIAEVLGITLDRLLGKSVSALVEEGLLKNNTTLEEVAKKTGVSLYWLQNLDDFVPGCFGDYEIGYEWITRVAEELGLSGSMLRAALARQETPVHDIPVMTIEEAFAIPVRNQGVRVKAKKIPLLGEIAAGKPVLVSEDHDVYLEVGEHLPVDFCLKVKGDSMINARIQDGDLVFVKKQSAVENGEIAVVLIDDEVTLKRFYRTEAGVILKPENPKYDPQFYAAGDFKNVRILGKAILFQSRL